VTRTYPNLKMYLVDANVSKLSTRGGKPASVLENFSGGNLQLDSAFCWQAVYSRDRRFDGRFFAGIATTGVYCRPICPVSFGHPENVQWFQSAAAAEAAGFRPCGRCHPDTSPGSSAWFGTWAVVSRALKLISEGALDGGNLDQLAERLGIGSRHLRRLFQLHLGASPLKIARSHRVLVARNLIVETQLPIAEIALGTGFRSIRQFNHSVRTAFGQSPRALRSLHGSAAASDPLAGILVHLPYRPPFDWQSMLLFLRSHATPGVESVEDDIYRRTLQIAGVTGAIEVWHEPMNARLTMRVVLPGCNHLMQVVQRARRLFDLGADALHIGSYLAQDIRLAGMVEERPGLRVPGAWDGFELAVLAVLGQNLAEESASAVEQLVKTFGQPVQVSIPGLTHLFPGPEILAHADLEKIEICAQHAMMIGALARAVLDGTLKFDSVKGAKETAELMHSLPGLKEETASYISMRSLGDPDAFPSIGLAFRRALATHRTPVSHEEVIRIFEGYRPWRAYAAMHYWTSMQQTVRQFRPQNAARKSSVRSTRLRSKVFRRPPSRP
jgi:AraC family transcriptional regulator of adaptative response / DNA-3-methyladenine glycosylase II